MTSLPDVRVVKVGGSLFDLPDLGQRLTQWLDSQSPAVNLLLAGGGELANVVRQLDRRFNLPNERAHLLALDTMAINASVLESQLPGSRVVDNLPAAIGGSTAGETLICDPRTSCGKACPPWCSTAPQTWDVTSDSLAAYLAKFVQANELVLLKSKPVTANVHWEELAQQGYVDLHFPTAVAKLPVRFACLRDQ